MTVAAAAPSTPHRNTATNKMSKSTLVTEENRIAQKGALLSPIARSTAK